jgi:hypothetical protein
MKTQWLRQWNRWQFLTAQLTLISVLFLYVVVVPNQSLMVALFLIVSGSTILAQWIGATLYERVDQARLNGDFRLLRRVIVVHNVHFLFGIAIVSGGYVLLMQWLALTQYVTVGVVLIGLVALDKVLSASLRAQATDMVLQAHALRRTVLIVGLLLGLVLRNETWIDNVMFGGLILAVSSSIVRLIVGHAQRYKEVRYQRQFEDSGKRQSHLSLLMEMCQRYATTLVHFVLPVGVVGIASVLYRFVIVVQQPENLARRIALLMAALALARLVVSTMLPEMLQWKQTIQSRNHSLLRDQAATMIEQVLYRSLIVGVVWFGTAVVLGPEWYGTFPSLLLSTAVLFLSSFYVLDGRLLSLLRASQQWTIVLVALVLFGTNGWLLSMMYPDEALLLGYVMMLVWFHLSTLVGLTQSIDFELRVHWNQSIRMITIAVTALVVNGSIYWLLSQFPLGVGRVVQQLVFLGLFAIITSVVMYSLTFALGVQRSLMSRNQVLHQLKTRFIDYEEEEAIW